MPFLYQLEGRDGKGGEKERWGCVSVSIKCFTNIPCAVLPNCLVIPDIKVFQTAYKKNPERLQAFKTNSTILEYLAKETTLLNELRMSHATPRLPCQETSSSVIMRIKSYLEERTGEKPLQVYDSHDANATPLTELQAINRLKSLLLSYTRMKKLGDVIRKDKHPRKRRSVAEAPPVMGAPIPQTAILHSRKVKLCGVEWKNGISAVKQWAKELLMQPFNTANGFPINIVRPNDNIPMMSLYRKPALRLNFSLIVDENPTPVDDDEPVRTMLAYGQKAGARTVAIVPPEFEVRPMPCVLQALLPLVRKELKNIEYSDEIVEHINSVEMKAYVPQLKNVDDRISASSLGLHVDCPQDCCQETQSQLLGSPVFSLSLGEDCKLKYCAYQLTRTKGHEKTGQEHIFNLSDGDGFIGHHLDETWLSLSDATNIQVSWKHGVTEKMPSGVRIVLVFRAVVHQRQFYKHNNRLKLNEEELRQMDAIPNVIRMHLDQSATGHETLKDWIERKSRERQQYLDTTGKLCTEELKKYFAESTVWQTDKITTTS